MRLPTRDQGAPGGAIEVELSDGHRLRAEAGADSALGRLFSRRYWIDDPLISGSRVWLATGYTDIVMFLNARMS